jgi:hypothetical protein
MTDYLKRGASLVAVSLGLSVPALADGITATEKAEVDAAFDIVETIVAIDGDAILFKSKVRGPAGSVTPAVTGTFAASQVYAYVWPTSLNSADVGFDKDQGIVALAATFHPDFDDAAKGGKNRDVWHAHWVVLGKHKDCKGGLRVVDIPKDANPTLPATWPGVPLLIDSPKYPIAFNEQTAEVRVPLSSIGAIKGAQFDGVTAGLRVNANLHAPLLCVENVFKVTSGDLSMPGTVQ